MNLAQSRKNINKLNKIKEIIEISKFVTMQEIAKAVKISQNALELSSLAKHIFEKAHQNFKLHSFYVKPSINASPAKLWVYVTFHKSLLDSGYDRQEKVLLENFNRSRDILVCVGDVAKSFAEHQNIKVSLYVDDNEKHATQKIASAIRHFYDEKLVSEVSFVLHTNRTTDSTITILPVAKLTIKAESKITHLNPKKYFPSLANTMENLTKIFINETTSAIYHEARYFQLKEKLVRLEDSIQAVEDRMVERRMEYVKASRKQRTEELIMISQNTARILKTEKMRRRKTQDVGGVDA